MILALHRFHIRDIVNVKKTVDELKEVGHEETTGCKCDTSLICDGGASE
jgi:hypothetical protein